MKRPKISDIEKRLARIKHVGNLQLQQLQCLYDGRPHVIAENYRRGILDLHLHFVRHLDGLASGSFCLNFREGSEIHFDIVGPNSDWTSMLVRIGEVAERAEPIISIVRLQVLNQCDFFFAESFKLGRNPPLELIFSVAYRKLQARIIDVRMSPLSERTHHIVQGDQKRLNDLTNQRLQSPQRIVDEVMGFERLGTLLLNGNDSRFRTTHVLDSRYEFRQTFFALIDPPVGIVH